MRKIRDARKPIRIMAWLLVAHMFALGMTPFESRASLVPPVSRDGSMDSLPESGMDRAGDLRTVQRVLETKVVQQRLKDLGFSREEIDTRLARLSDAQLHQVASQINSLLPGGSIDGALGTILTVLLIILVAVVIVILL
jgi:ribose 1,5-bisphosphokinase PhnN